LLPALYGRGSSRSRPLNRSFVGDYLFNLKTNQQRPSLGYIVDVADTGQTPNRILKPIDAGMKLGGQPTTGATDRLIAWAPFFGAPADADEPRSLYYQ